MIASPLHFIDLNAQQEKIRHKLDARIKTVLDHGKYIMGPEIDELEKELSLFCGAKHSISCANGTDALGLILMAKNIGPGDAVFVPTFTFAATAEVVAWVGATPVFIDSDPISFNMSVDSLKQGIEKALSLGLTPKCIIPVDLFGLPADFDAIEKVAKTYNLWILDDAAQGFGATYKGKTVGNIAHVTATSFFPAKPLGCYGDGGAIFTNDDELASIIKSLRVHGQGRDKYDNIRIGINGRLDTLQAAILLEKLVLFPDEIIKRNNVAKTYTDALKDKVQTPFVPDCCVSTWAQYTFVLPHHIKRADVMEHLTQAKIPTVVYYPNPLHTLTAYKTYPMAQERLTVAEDLASRVLSLPMHPYLTQETQAYIIDNVIKSMS